MSLRCWYLFNSFYNYHRTRSIAHSTTYNNMIYSHWAAWHTCWLISNKICIRQTLPVLYYAYWLFPLTTLYTYTFTEPLDLSRDSSPCSTTFYSHIISRLGKFPHPPPPAWTSLPPQFDTIIPWNEEADITYNKINRVTVQIYPDESSINGGVGAAVLYINRSPQ